MLKRGSLVKKLLLVALLLFNFERVHAQEDDGQLNDDPGAIDSEVPLENNNDDNAADAINEQELDQAPEHAEYPVEETHQVLKYVQDRADGPKYSRDPHVEVKEKIIAVSPPVKKTKVIKPLKKHQKKSRSTTKKRLKTKHSK